MRNKIVVVTFLTLLLGVASCKGVSDGKVHGRRAIAMLMDSAEVVMNDAPEYAYRLLDSIDSHSIPSRALNARYALLYSETLYKNYIPAQSDSLIMIAVRYYSVGKHPELLFRSFYSLGCIYNEAGRLIDAAVALGQAEQLAVKMDNGYRLGLLYTQLGNVFFRSFDFGRAKLYYNSAYDEYKRVCKESHQMHALYDMGRCLMELKDYESAHGVMEEVKKWAEKNNQYKLVSSSLLNQLSCSVHEKKLEVARFEAERYVDLFGLPKDHVSALSKFAFFYILDDNIKTARVFLDEAWHICNPSDSINLLYIESILQEATGNTDLAINLYKKSIEIQNSNIRLLLNQPVLGAQKDYYKSLSEVESIRASRNRNVAILLFVILVLLIIIVRIISYSRELRIDAERQGYLLTIKELHLKENSNNEIINQLNKRVNALFVKQYAELDEVFDKMIELDIAFPVDYNKAQLGEQRVGQKYYMKQALFHKKVRAKFEEIKSPKNQKALDSIINEVFDNIMVRLSDKKLKLSREDMLMLRLLICGFSPKVVSYLVSEQQKSIYQKRNRILKRVDRISSDLAQDLCIALRIR